jgi:multiple sugar transport system permease protein
MIENPSARIFRQSLTYFILSIGALVMIFPLLWTVSTSLKTPDKVTLRQIELIPDPIAFENYVEIFTQQPIARYTRNTVILAVAALFGALVPSSLAAYGFARIPFPGRKWLFGILLATMMLPHVVRIIPLFVFFDRIGWINTFWPLILPRVLGHNAFYIFLMRQFFKGIPEDLFDAARIDGASELGVWWRIAMPISLPVLAAVSIFAFQASWNDFLNPLIYLGATQENWTLTLGLNALQGFEGDQNTLNVMMTFSMLLIIPMLIVFYFGQKYLIEGVSVGGVKG